MLNPAQIAAAAQGWLSADAVPATSTTCEVLDFEPFFTRILTFPSAEHAYARLAGACSNFVSRVPHDDWPRFAEMDTPIRPAFALMAECLDLSATTFPLILESAIASSIARKIPFAHIYEPCDAFMRTLTTSDGSRLSSYFGYAIQFAAPTAPNAHSAMMAHVDAFLEQRQIAEWTAPGSSPSTPRL